MRLSKERHHGFVNISLLCLSLVLCQGGDAAPTEIKSMVVDASMVMTRLHFYIIMMEKKNSLTDTRVINETTYLDKFSLSSFIGRSRDAVELVNKLMLKALPDLKKSPNDKISTELKDPKPLLYELNFQATSGMKILSVRDKEAADDIMNSIRTLLITKYNHKVKLCQHYCFGIIRGEEEALHSFVATNFLLRRFTGNRHVADLEADTYVGIIEMGGADFSVAFPTSSSGYPKLSGCASSVNHKFAKFLRGQCIYARSYLFYGTKVAHLRMVGIQQECLLESCGKDSKFKPFYESPCLNQNFSRNIPVLSNQTILVRGNASKLAATERYLACYKIAKDSVITNSSIEAVGGKELAYNPFYLLRLFFSTLFDLRLVPAEGATVTLRKLEQFAVTACQNPATTGDHQPFYCMDLSYYVAVLREGLHFIDDQKFIVTDKIRGIHVGWPLGAALQAAFSN